VDEVTPARVKALETQVETLAQLLAGSLAAVGALNAHVAAALDAVDTPEDRKRMEEINADVAELYDKLSAIWPEPP
jgi:hypothetical protein